MEFIAPVSSGYTVYTKQGCSYCSSVKRLLIDMRVEYTTVECDEYLAAGKEAFLQFIHAQAGKEYKTFPMVFYDKQFIGGYLDTKAFILKSNLPIR